MGRYSCIRFLHVVRLQNPSAESLTPGPPNPLDPDQTWEWLEWVGSGKPAQRSHRATGTGQYGGKGRRSAVAPRPRRPGAPKHGRGHNTPERIVSHPWPTAGREDTRSEPGTGIISCSKPTCSGYLFEEFSLAPETDELRVPMAHFFKPGAVNALGTLGATAGTLDLILGIHHAILPRKSTSNLGEYVLKKSDLRITR